MLETFALALAVGSTFVVVFLLALLALSASLNALDRH